MAVPIETLLVKISADVTDLKAKMGVAQKTTTQAMAKTNASLRTSIASWAKWAAAAAGAFKVVQSALSQLRIIDQLAKTSDALGIATEELAAMQFAGKLAGVEIAQLTTGISFMTRNIGEAARGTGEAKDALEDLGLNVNELVGMSPDQQFEKIAEAMTQVSTTSERASITMDIFGRSGIKMINMLQGGKKGLDSARRATQAYGTAVTKLDAKKITDLNDAVTEMKEAWIGVMRRMLVNIAPTLVKAIHTIINAIDVLRMGWHGAKVAVTEFSAIVYKAISALARATVVSLNAMIEGVNMFTDAFSTAGDTVAGTVGGISKNYARIGKIDITETKNNLDKFVSLAKTASADAQGEIAKITEQMMMRQRQWQEQAAAGMRAAGVGAGPGAAPGATTDADVRAVQEQRRQRAEAEHAFKLFLMDDETRALHEQLDTRLEALRGFHDAGAIGAKEMHDRMREAREAHDARMDDLDRQRALNRWRNANETANLVIGTFRGLTATMEEDSREQFELTKALNIAETIMNTSAAVMNIWARIKNPWAAGTLTAIAVAAGAAQISKIASTEFSPGGGGGGGAPSPGPSPAGVSTSGGEGGVGGAGPAQDINVTLVGEVFHGEAIRGLLERLSEEAEDMPMLNVRTV